MGAAPAELAALVAREVDAGVATALTAIDAGGVLVLDTVIARVASGADQPGPTDPPDWGDIAWSAEVVMHVDPAGSQRLAAAPQGVGGEPRVPDVVAALPVRAIRGVGAAWSERLAAVHLTTVGALATTGPGTLAALAQRWGMDLVVLAGRARSCAVTLPEGTAAVLAEVSVRDLALGDPAALPGAMDVTTAWWRAATTLLAALDADVLHGIPAADLL